MLKELKAVDKSNIVIASFNKRILKNIAALNTSIRLCLETRFLTTRSIKFAQDIGCEYITCNINFLTKRSVKNAQNSGLKVIVYTINNVKMLRKSENCSVDGIFTDGLNLLK